MTTNVVSARGRTKRSTGISALKGNEPKINGSLGVRLDKFLGQFDEMMEERVSSRYNSIIGLDQLIQLRSCLISMDE